MSILKNFTRNEHQWKLTACEHAYETTNHVQFPVTFQQCGLRDAIVFIILNVGLFPSLWKKLNITKSVEMW